MSTRPVVLGAIALALLFVSLAPSLLHAQERVRIGVSSRGFGSLPIFVADKKGFYTKYNLRSEMILLRSSVAVPALLSGDLDYYNGFQPVISAALKGIPIKLVMMTAEKVIFLVLVKPDVKSIHDLKGKTIGVNAAGSTIHLSLLSILNRFRLDPAKERENSSRRRRAQSARRAPVRKDRRADQRHALGKGGDQTQAYGACAA